MYKTPVELEALVREGWDELPRWVRILFRPWKESIVLNAALAAVRKQGED